MFMERLKNNLEKYPCRVHSSNCSVLCIITSKRFVLPSRDCPVDCFLEDDIRVILICIQETIKPN